MAINPVQLFQNPSTSILEQLNGANNIIGGLFDRAIQIGRDSVNNQMKNQTDMLNMRAQETALEQRRGENLQQNIEDAQRSARNAYEFDVKFGSQQQQQGLQNTRQAANDLFAQNDADRKFDLYSSNTEADNARQDAALKLRQDELGATREFNQGIIDQPTTAETSQPTIMDRVMGFFGGGQEEPQSDNYFTQIEQARAKQAAAKANKNSAAYNAAIKEEGDAMRAQANARTNKPLSPIQIERNDRARRAEDRTIQKTEMAAQDRDINLLVDDTAAFVPQTVLLPEEATASQKAAANAYDKDRIGSEINSAKNYSEDAYVKLVPNLTEVQKDKRRQLWRYANAQSATAPSPAAQTPALSYDPATDTWK